MLITPIGIVELDHRAYHISCSSKNFVFAVAAQNDRISFFDRKFTVHSLDRNWGKIRSISINASGELIAVSHDRTLSIVNLDGEIIFTDSIPYPNERYEGWFEHGSDDCFFNHHTGSLWYVALPTSNRIEIQIREPKNWSITQKITIDNPLSRYSYCFLYPIPYANTVQLWIADGQYGQQLCWLSENSELNYNIEWAPFVDTIPATFSPDGNEFLVLDDENNLCRFSYPNVRKLGECEWPFDEDDDEYHGFSYFSAYIDNQYALVNSEDGRLFLLELETMSLVREILIKNHEPRPCEEVYSFLNGAKYLCSNISSFEKFGDTFIGVYERDRNTNPGLPKLLCKKNINSTVKRMSKRLKSIEK